MVAAEELVHQLWLDETEDAFSYDRPKPAVIDEKKFTAMYGENCFDEMTCFYGIANYEGKSFKKEYEELVKYFSKIHGKGEKFVPEDLELSNFLLTLDQKSWIFTLDTGIKYRLSVAHHQSINVPDSILSMVVSRDGA